MSVQAMTWALAQRIVTEATARHVLLCLANYAGPDGKGAFPSVETLAIDTGLSIRTVQYKLEALEAQQVITRGNQDIVKAYIRRGDRRPVCYDIDISRGAADAPRSERGANDDSTGCKPQQNGVQMTTERGAPAAPNPSLNHQGTVKEPKGARKRSPGFDALNIELPEWLDRSDWEVWVAHRKEIGKPLTEQAVKQQLASLAEYRAQGWKPATVIRHCVNGSYQGLFKPPGTPPNGAGAAGGGRPGKFNPTEYVNRNRAQGGNDYDDGRTINV